MSRLAITSGIGGQDAAYLTEFLLNKDYKVIGLHRRYSTLNTWRLDELGITNHKNLSLIECDIVDGSSVSRIISRYKPDEFYSLAAMSHVGSSFDCPDLTLETNGNAVINMLEAIRLYSPHTRFYQASTSELYGSNFTIKDGRKVQDESTLMTSNSPYGLSKHVSHGAVDLYRRSYNLFAVAGILFNHESPFRGDNFVSRKISKWIGNFIKWKTKIESEEYNKGIEYKFDGSNISTYRTNPDNKPYPDNASWLVGPQFPKLKLGNLEAVRDFGYSKEFVECMWLMLQQDKPKDYVVGTGVPTSIREFLDYCFEEIGIKDWSPYVEIDKSLFRNCEVEFLCADPSLIENELGWKAKTTVKELAKLMVKADIERIK